MPAAPPYIPEPQADFNNWANNFATVINTAPAQYGLSSADSATISAAVGNWSTAYSAVTSPTTKTKTTVQAKDTARAQALAVLRPYAQQIANNAGVATSDKLAVGVNPRTSKPTPITTPNTFPALALQSQAPRTAVLRYRDSAASVSVKAKPYGVTQCQVFGMTSATPVTDQDALPMIATPTKSPFTLNFTAAQAGLQMYVAARWAIRTGDYGPWSPIVSFTVTNGG